MFFKSEGIVLRETEYNEADKLLTVLTKDHGRLTLKARGVRRNKSSVKSACQFLAFSEFTWQEYQGKATITEAVSIEQFRELRDDIELLSLSSYFAQLAELLSQEDAYEPTLLSLMLNALYALAKLKKPQRLVKAVFELKAACIAGFLPNLQGCAVCGEKQPDRLNVSHGILQCSACKTDEWEGLRVPLSAGTLAAIRYIVSCEDKKIFSFKVGEHTLQELNTVTEAYLMTQLEHSFYTLDFYKSLFLTENTYE